MHEFKFLARWMDDGTNKRPYCTCGWIGEWDHSIVQGQFEAHLESLGVK